MHGGPRRESRCIRPPSPPSKPLGEDSCAPAPAVATLIDVERASIDKMMQKHHSSTQNRTASDQPISAEQPATAPPPATTEWRSHFSDDTSKEPPEGGNHPPLAERQAPRSTPALSPRENPAPAPPRFSPAAIVSSSLEYNAGQPAGRVEGHAGETAAVTGEKGKGSAAEKELEEQTAALFPRAHPPLGRRSISLAVMPGAALEAKLFTLDEDENLSPLSRGSNHKTSALAKAVATEPAQPSKVAMLREQLRIAEEEASGVQGSYLGENDDKIFAVKNTTGQRARPVLPQLEGVVPLRASFEGQRLTGVGEAAPPMVGRVPRRNTIMDTFGMRRSAEALASTGVGIDPPNDRMRVRRGSIEAVGAMLTGSVEGVGNAFTKARRMSVEAVLNVGDILFHNKAPTSPKLSPRSKRVAIGNEAAAFLSMVPGGDGRCISRKQYQDLLDGELKRLSLKIDKDVKSEMVDAVFQGGVDSLDNPGFSDLLARIKLPIGDLARKISRSGGLNRSESVAELKPPNTFLSWMRTAYGKMYDDNGARVCLLVYSLFNLVLFLEVFISRRGWFVGEDTVGIGGTGGVWVDFARGFGMICNFNCAFVLVPMMRSIVTSIQETWLNKWIPFEKAYDFHQLVGTTAFVFGTLHGIAHVINLITWKDWTWSGTMWCGAIDDGFLFCSAATGIMVQTIFTIIGVFATNKLRTSRTWNYFWTTHHLGLLFYIILLFHARDFWKWFLGPILAYLLERYHRRRNAQFTSKVLKTEYKGQEVIQVRFEKPEGLNYLPGQWVFIKSSMVSKYELHPFTLSSCPDDPYLECHIKAVGDWTGDFYSLYDSQHIEDGKQVYSLPAFNLQIEGPHGAPAQDWTNYERTVLISTGIGITPFASVIKHIRRRMQQSNAIRSRDLDVPGCLNLRVKKVTLIWICRNQESIAWFTDVINEAKMEMGDDFDVQVYLSSVNALGDVRAGITHIGMHAYFQKTNKDAITGLNNVLTLYDRPNWNNIFRTFCETSPNEKLGVFFCGPHSLGHTLKKTCATFTSTSSTSFSFFQEHF